MHQRAASQTRTTRILVLVVALLAFGFWTIANTSLVGLLLIGYNGVTQFFPGVVLGVGGRRPPAIAVGGGIVAGLLMLIFFTVTGRGNVEGINIGLIALVVNAAVLAIVWAVAPKPSTGGEKYFCTISMNDWFCCAAPFSPGITSSAVKPAKNTSSSMT